MRHAALLPLILIAGCGKAPPAPRPDLEALDRQLVADKREPSLTALLHDEIMVDPQLVGRANTDAVRPPPRPDAGSVPPDDVGAPADTSKPSDLKAAPAPTGDCPDCKAARGALTLGALAERQSQASVQACSASLRYATGWAARLPAALPLYPDARIAEAAGSDAKGCALRVVSFASQAPVSRVTDWFYAHALSGGYSADHRGDGTERVLRGAKPGGQASFMLYLRPRPGGGSDADLVVAGG